MQKWKTNSFLGYCDIKQYNAEKNVWYTALYIEVQNILIIIIITTLIMYWHFILQPTQLWQMDHIISTSTKILISVSDLQCNKHRN